MGIRFYYISSTHCQRKKERQLIIFTFRVADTYPQIYDLIGKFCKTCCDFFSPHRKQLLASSKAISKICQHFTVFTFLKSDVTLFFSDDSLLQKQK